MNKLLQEERIEACKLYFNQFHKIPRIKETMMFKGIKFNDESKFYRYKL